MRALSCILVYGSGDGGEEEKDENDGHYGDLRVAAEEARDVNGVYALANFLDERMCVPRDMGMMSADAVKRVALLGK